MKITPQHIARSLIDTVAENPAMNVDDACLSAYLVLRKRCPSMHPRTFVRLVEREVKRRGTSASGLLVVPHERSLKAEIIAPLLAKKSDKNISMDRTVDPEIIGGAVLLIDHRRIDSSIKGALDVLLQTCLQPLE